LKGVQDLHEIRSLIVQTVRKVPGVLADPGPEALVLDLSDLESNAVKVKVLWWTKGPRQHEMLTSFDKVLTAIRQALGRNMGGRSRAA
jgi:small conductance mechanosensitive channel